MTELEKQVRNLAEYLGCNEGELWSELEPMFKKVSTKTIEGLRIGELLCEDCKVKRAGRMVGQAFTSYVCQACEKDCMHHNTGTPNYCNSCAWKQWKCQRCMQDLGEIQEIRI